MEILVVVWKDCGMLTATRMSNVTDKNGLDFDEWTEDNGQRTTTNCSINFDRRNLAKNNQPIIASTLTDEISPPSGQILSVKVDATIVFLSPFWL